MEITKEKLNLEEGLTKEWLITNGIGGFASSSVIGANTRKYHGLMVAPLNPPAKRFLILSKVDEAIEIEEKLFGDCFETEDQKAAMANFLEKDKEKKLKVVPFINK